MTVKELIIQLQDMNQSAEIFTCAFEGYTEVAIIGKVKQSESGNYVTIYKKQ